MMTFAVDGHNDLLLGCDGQLCLHRGRSALQQLCRHYALAIRGEMLHKANQGMPLAHSLFGASADLALFETAFRQRMKAIPEVIDVIAFEARLNDSRLSYHATIKTRNETVEVNDG